MTRHVEDEFAEAMAARSREQARPFDDATAARDVHHALGLIAARYRNATPAALAALSPEARALIERAVTLKRDALASWERSPAMVAMRMAADAEDRAGVGLPDAFTVRH
jgi:hypothetical protein